MPLPTSVLTSEEEPPGSLRHVFGCLQEACRGQRWDADYDWLFTCEYTFVLFSGFLGAGIGVVETGFHKAQVGPELTL